MHSFRVAHTYHLPRKNRNTVPALHGIFERIGASLYGRNLPRLQTQLQQFYELMC